MASSDGRRASIRTERLVRHFGATRAVDGIDLEVAPGEIYGFLGPNGAGKTTAVRMLVTLLSPTSGDAWVAGHSVTTAPDRVRLRIGVALQETALDGKQTGVETLRLQARLYGLSAGDAERRIDDLRTLIDIGEALDARVAQYSGGMRRRLDLAAALVHNPDVLFLDEPTTGLDPISRVRVWEEIRRLNAELGMTIFLTTQYLEEADELADRVGIIAQGRIVAEGPPAQLKRAVGDDLIIARVGGGDAGALADRLRGLDGIDRVDVRDDEVTAATPDGADAIGRVALAIGEADLRATQLTLRTPTLDDVFLDVTGERLRADDETAPVG